MDNVLILSPHCDDAPLSLGAALLTGALGVAPHVPIVFSLSRYTKDQPCTGPLEEVTELRNAEERLAGEQAGYHPRFLGFGEPFARPGFHSIADIMDLTRREEDDLFWPKVHSAIEEIVSEHPGLVIAPLACGGHIDHRIVHRSVLLCCQKNPGLAVGFYEDLPYSEELADSEIDLRISALKSLCSVQPFVVDTGLQEKLSLLRIYRSQLIEWQFTQVKRYWARRGGERLWLPPLG